MRKLYIIFGPPGCGKGTQSAILIDKYGFCYISTGDMLRQEVAKDTPLGKTVGSLMEAGQLVPDDLMIEVIGAFFEANLDKQSFLFDGFPRTKEQARALETIMSRNKVVLEGVIFLQVPNEELIPRLIERGKTSGRPDDSDPDKIATRLEVYKTQTLAVHNYYNDDGTKILSIDGVGAIEEVTNRIQEALESETALIQ